MTGSPRSNCNLIYLGIERTRRIYRSLQKKNHWASLVTEKRVFWCLSLLSTFPLETSFSLSLSLFPSSFLAFSFERKRLSDFLCVCVWDRHESRVSRRVPGPLIFCKRQKIRDLRETRDASRALLKNRCPLDNILPSPDAPPLWAVSRWSPFWRSAKGATSGCNTVILSDNTLLLITLVLVIN